MTTFSISDQLRPATAEIADATIRVIVSKGLDAVSVRSVAKEHGVAIGTVQYHARNRDALLAQAFIRSIQRQISRSLHASDVGTPAEILARRLAELLPTGGEQSEDACIWVSFGSASATRSWLAELYSEALEQFRSYLVAALSEADQLGALTPGLTPESGARLLTALVNGLTTDNLCVPERARQQMLTDLDNGIALMLGART